MSDDFSYRDAFLKKAKSTPPATREQLRTFFGDKEFDRLLREEQIRVESEDQTPNEN